MWEWAAGEVVQPLSGDLWYKSLRLATCHASIDTAGSSTFRLCEALWYKQLHVAHRRRGDRGRDKKGKAGNPQRTSHRKAAPLPCRRPHRGLLSAADCTATL